MIVAIIQARMGSSRLPGKTFADISGKPLLTHVVERISRAKRIDQVAIATADGVENDCIREFANRRNIPIFSGSEDDVLSRYVSAGIMFGANVIVRITADCPLIDPDITDEVIQAYLDSRADFATNCYERTYPRGLDVEVFSLPLLRKIDKLAILPYDHEHVTAFIYNNPRLFDIASVKTIGPLNCPDLRLCVDTSDDLAFVRRVFSKFPNNEFSALDILSICKT